MTTGTHRMRITLDVTVDPETWALVYGDDALADNGDEVASYVLGQVQGSAAAEAGAITEVTLR